MRRRAAVAGRGTERVDEMVVPPTPSATESSPHGADPSPRLEQELLHHPTIARLGRAVYTPDGLRVFLTSPSPRFDGRTALDLMRSGEEERVISALASDYEAIS